MTQEHCGFIDGANGKIAFRAVRPEKSLEPGVIWFGGYRSDMTGEKASAIAEWALRADRSFVRFDYAGHGNSEGSFETLAISDWLNDAIAVLDGLTRAPQIFVGSSMGAWIALLTALRRAERLHAALLIAPAVDFTEALVWAGLTEDQRRELTRVGRIEIDDRNSDRTSVFSQRLILDGRSHLLLNQKIPLNAPIRILQGMNDSEVPWLHAIEVAEAIMSDDVALTLFKNGDHRLSRPEYIAHLIHQLADL